MKSGDCKFRLGNWVVGAPKTKNGEFYNLLYTSLFIDRGRK